MENESVQERLLAAIDGRGSFQRFKKTVYEEGIQDVWFEFRLNSIKPIVREFLDANKLKYSDK